MGKRERELTVDDIKGFKVAELKEELKARGIDGVGKKADLIEQLTAAISSDSADAPAAAPSPKKSKSKSPKASPKMSPKKAPKAAPSTMKTGTVVGFPEFGEEDHEIAGRWLMCVGPILSQI